MFCQKCQQESEGGKFCTNCGTPLANDEHAVTVEQGVDSSEQPVATETQVPVATEQKEEPNEFVEKAKNIASLFGDFFLTLVQKPSEARKFNQKHLTSAIITIVIFTLFIALNSYFVSQSIYDDLYGPSVTFLDDFLKPLVKNLVGFGLIATVTFAATKVALQDISYADVIAKYGAYLMPFLLLYIVGMLLSLLTLGFPFTLASTVGLSGTVLVVPVLILIEQPIKKFDKVYIIIGLILAAQIISSSLNRISSSWF